MNFAASALATIFRKTLGISSICVALWIPSQEMRGEDDPQELTDAREGYKREVEFATRSIRDRYFSKLEALKRSLGSKGDLRAALAVEQEIGRVKESVIDAAGVEKFAGTWRIRYSNNFVRRYVINGDGFVTYNELDGKPITPKKGKIIFRNLKYILDLKEGGFEVLTLSANALKVEVFPSKEALAAGTAMASGVSINEAQLK